MINILVTIDVILALVIIGCVFLHQGADGFIGETAPVSGSGPRFETFDKILGLFVFLFFAITFSINYLTLYQYKGTADVDAILEKQTKQEKAKKVEEQNPEFTTEAPIAE